VEQLEEKKESVNAVGSHHFLKNLHMSCHHSFCQQRRFFIYECVLATERKIVKNGGSYLIRNEEMGEFFGLFKKAIRPFGKISKERAGA
jgi:hypothetical protein